MNSMGIGMEFYEFYGNSDGISFCFSAMELYAFPWECIEFHRKETEWNIFLFQIYPDP